MKMIFSLLGISAILCLSGCTVEEHRERPRRVIVEAPPPPPPVVYEQVPYDDPGRGWYIEGYFGPGHVWIAPFWTRDVVVVHEHFDHYRGHYRPRFENDFKHHPERFERRDNDNRGRDNRGNDNRGRDDRGPDRH